MLAWPGLTVKYTGGESRQSSVLRAPPGTSLDDTDVAYCQSRAFGSTGWFVFTQRSGSFGFRTETTSLSPSANAVAAASPD